MKKLLIIPVLLSLLFTTSCVKSGISTDFPDYTYATIREATGLEYEVYFELDNNEKIYIDKNSSSVTLSSLTIGDRVIVGVDLYDSEISGYKYGINLRQIIGVTEGENVVVNSEAENNAIANDAVESVYSNITLTYGYLNTYVSYSSTDLSSAKFYLVEVTYEDAEETDEDYANFELRYDNGGGDSETEFIEETAGYVSFNMESFILSLSGKKGIILRLCIEDSDDVYVQVDAENLF